MQPTKTGIAAENEVIPDFAITLRLTLERSEIVRGRLAGELIDEGSPESLAEIFGNFARKDSGLSDRQFGLIEAALEVAVAGSFVFVYDVA